LVVDHGVNSGSKEDSSFSEEKEAKRLLSIWRVFDWATYADLQKFFGSFLQKRTASLNALSFAT
jgi:hypothetical protein